MIPILYEKTETTFTNNGLGRLSDCIRCIVTEERNGIFECEFDYPVSGPMFSQIEEGRIIACTHDEQGDVQPFDIYGRSEPINGVVTFYAHHISYRLNEITVKPFTAGSCAEALTKIKSESVNTNPFTFWTNKSVASAFNLDVPKNAKDMLCGSQGSILDIYGTGEYKYNKFNVNLYLHRGQDTNVSIRYGKNLVDYTNDYDTSGVYTAVVPYWLGEETQGEQTVTRLIMLPELFLSSGHTVPSGREVVVPMDLSGDFTEVPTVAQLRAAATTKLARAEGWTPNQTVKVNFVQLWQTEEYADYAVLQRLRLCDTCGIFVPMYGTSLRAKVIRVVYNVLLDRYDEMELGDKPTTYSAVLEKMYASQVAGVEAGLKSIKVDLGTVANIAAADAAEKAATAEQNAKDYADSSVSDLRDELETQIDAKIETWAQATNPASNWNTAELRAQHNADLWLYTGTSDITVGSVTIKPQGVYKYNGSSNTWSAYSSTSNNLFDLVDGKSTIYYGSTSGTYANKEVGDYLVDSSTGATYRWTGSAWVKVTDYKTYTDAEISSLKDDLESQIDAKIETWAQSTNPAAAWTSATLRAEHTGDLWLYTGTSNLTVGNVTIKPQGVYQYVGSSNTWLAYSSTAKNLFDLVDGKSTIYYGAPGGVYSGVETGDYLVDSATGATYRWTGSAWVKVTDYKTYTDTEIASAKTSIQSEYEQAIDDATELIRGGTGGYIVTTVNANGQPIELLITDNLNLNQAVNVWRWNSGGLGHSHSGYNGPYNDVAITQDGKINASMILTGALTANIITAGTLKDANNKNSWDLDSGQFKTEQGQIGPFRIASTGLTYTGQTSKTVIDNDGIATLSRASIGSDHIVGGAAIKSATIKFTYAADGNYDVDSATVASRIALVRTTIPSINYGIAFFSQSNTLQLGLYDDGATYPVDFTGDTRIKGNFVVASGYTKSREVETDNYGKRLQYSYETPVPMFGDIGEVIIDEDGLGYVDIDDIFSETIAGRVEYQVFLQKEGEGDCWIAEKSPRYFVVQGTPGLKVAWELKAKQKEFVNTRLEQSENYLDEYEYRNNENDLLNDYITEQEALLYGNY